MGTSTGLNSVPHPMLRNGTGHLQRVGSFGFVLGSFGCFWVFFWVRLGSFWVRFFGGNRVFDSARAENWVRFARKNSLNSVPHPVSHGALWDNGMGHPRDFGEW